MSGTKFTLATRPGRHLVTPGRYLRARGTCRRAASRQPPEAAAGSRDRCLASPDERRRQHPVATGEAPRIHRHGGSRHLPGGVSHRSLSLLPGGPGGLQSLEGDTPPSGFSARCRAHRDRRSTRPLDSRMDGSPEPGLHHELPHPFPRVPQRASPRSPRMGLCGGALVSRKGGAHPRRHRNPHPRAWRKAGRKGARPLAARRRYRAIPPRPSPC